MCNVIRYQNDTLLKKHKAKGNKKLKVLLSKPLQARKAFEAVGAIVYVAPEGKSGSKGNARMPSHKQ